ncbi:MAG: PorP/SprF family type IX secretion system membrane protein [Cyclobacteriaceae bacterium]
MKNLTIKLGLGIAIMLLSLVKVSGQNTDFTQYYLNMPSINPGFTGIEDFTDMKMSFRQGWNGFGAKNSNYYVSAYGALKSSIQSTLRNNSLRISDPSVFNEIQNNKELRSKLRRKHGLGGMIEGKDIGSFKSTRIAMNYAYHLPLSSTVNWSLGTSLSYQNRSVNFSGFTVRDELNDLFYQQLLRSGNGRNNMFLIDFGTSIYTQEMYFAFSSSGLVTKEISGDNEFQLETIQNYTFQAGKIFSVSPSMDLSTGTRVDYSDLYDLNWSLNARLRYNKLIYLGASYQDKIKTSGIFGVTIDGKYNFNYAYDFYTSTSSNFRVSVHEVVIGIALFNQYQLSTRMW